MVITKQKLSTLSFQNLDTLLKNTRIYIYTNIHASIASTYIHMYIHIYYTSNLTQLHGISITIYTPLCLIQ